MSGGRAGRSQDLPTWLFVGVIVGCAVVLTGLDGWAYRAIGPTMESRARLEGQWWYMGLRHVGSLWSWVVLGGVLAVVGAAARRSRLLRSGAFVALAAGLAGLGAELLKLVIGRERPATIRPVDGVETLVYQGYQFRGLFSGFLDGSNLGLPSSHAATAAGGAFAVAMLCRPLAPVVVALALGCGLTRMLAGAHFATDVYVGILLGWLVAGALHGPLVRRGEQPA